MTTKKKERAERKTRLVSYDHFTQGCEDLSMSKEKLTSLMGFSNGTDRHWEKKGMMPRVASMAIASLRKGNGKSDGTATMLVLVEKKDQAQIEQILSALPCCVQTLSL
jgi:DNA-binding transcriptional regulator YiaG